jgi:hypothetical protein
VLPEFDKLAEQLRKGDLGEGYVKAFGQMLPKVVGDIKVLVRTKAKDAGVDLADNYKGLASNAEHVALRDAREEGHRHARPADDEHGLRRASSRKDQEKKGKPYWRTRWEMFARAFETYVADRLAAAKQANTFLSDAALRAGVAEP